MSNAATLSAVVLSATKITDDHFFEATEVLSSRLDSGGKPGDLRSDDEAPQILFDWLRHASARVPDFRVWALSSQLDAFLDPCSGIPFPGHWPWHTRDRLVGLNAELRANLAWAPAFEAATDEANEAVRRWLECLHF